MYAKNFIYKSMIAIATVVVMAGCAADDYLNDITKTRPNDESEAFSDDITKALTAAGFEDIDVADSTFKLNNEECVERFYFFTLNQPISHHNKALGTYKQHMSLRISDPTAPVMLYTHGYAMDTKPGDIGIDQITTVMSELSGKKASELHVEHRYFGQSLPETYESLAFTYLNADEAAHDLDSVLVRLQNSVLKESGAWISTGTSKDGITSGLLAYYADKYGWNDKSRDDYFRIDLYMPFCAPFLVGTPESCDDPQIGYYLYNTCGNGYDAGTDEAKAYAQLRKIPAAIVMDKELREACLRKFHVMDPSRYLEILNTYGTDEEKMSAAMVNTYMDKLFAKFSYVPYYEWAPLVPSVDAAIADAVTEGEKIAKAYEVEKLANFIFTDDKTILSLKNTVSAKSEAATTRSQERKIYTDEEILSNLYSEKTYPYEIQSVIELGNTRIDFSMLDGIKFSPEATEDMGYVARFIGKSFEASTELTKYKDRWDGGALMRSYREWAIKNCTAKMVYVYAYNDPWTGGAIDNPQISNVTKYIFGNSVHNPYILNRRYYTEEEYKILESHIQEALGSAK